MESPIGPIRFLSHCAAKMPCAPPSPEPKKPQYEENINPNVMLPSRIDRHVIRMVRALRKGLLRNSLMPKTNNETGMARPKMPNPRPTKYSPISAPLLPVPLLSSPPRIFPYDIMLWSAFQVNM